MALQDPVISQHQPDRAIIHNCNIATLKKVIEFYNLAGIANDNLDPLIKPPHLSTAEINDHTAFLENLTGDNAAELASDEFAAPVGDRQ